MFEGTKMTDKMPKVYLSERNLRTLLAKLERERLGQPTDCTLIKEQTPSPAYRQTMKSVAVIAVQDADFYGEHEPSAVYPSDDQKLQRERLVEAHMAALPILIEGVRRLPRQDAAKVLSQWDQARTPKMPEPPGSPEQLTAPLGHVPPDIKRAESRSEPFAWATFDGEGSYDLRLYENNESYRDDYLKRNGPQYTSWIIALYSDGS